MYETEFLTAEEVEQNTTSINKDIVYLNIKEQILNPFFNNNTNYLKFFSNILKKEDTDSLVKATEETSLYTKMKEELESNFFIKFGFEGIVLDNERKDFINAVYSKFVLKFRSNLIKIMTNFIIQNKDYCISLVENGKRKDFNLIHIEELNDEGVAMKSIFNQTQPLLTTLVDSINFNFDAIEHILFDTAEVETELYLINEAYYNKDRIYFNIEDGFMSKLKDIISNEDVLNVLAFEVRNRLFNIYKK